MPDRRTLTAPATVARCHDHPSRDPTPSAKDRATAERLADAGRLLDTPVHDHVVGRGGRYASFAEAGWT